MRALVIGATGYVASRAIPALSQAGIDVVAGARTPANLDGRWWREQVDVVRLDVCDPDSVAQAFSEPLDAVLYLVHGMASADFEDADRTAATLVRDACNAAGVTRIVYVSGIIPEPATDLSAHLRSRYEVEQILRSSHATTIVLRAALLIGSGSTSFELMRQLATSLPVTVLPSWMEHAVEPLAITDLVRAIVGAMRADISGRSFDVGGGEKMGYPDLIGRFLELAGSPRTSVTLPALPEPVVAKIASWISDIPSHTVEALIESLRHDLVAADAEWVTALGDGEPRVGTDHAILRALATVDEQKTPSQRDPLGPMPGDPDWAR